MSLLQNERLPQSQHAWLQRELLAQLRNNQYGNAVATTAALFLSRITKDKALTADMARFLSLVVTRPWGSIEGIAHALHTWAARQGRKSRLHEDTIRLLLQRWKDLFLNRDVWLQELEQWAVEVFQAQWSLAWAEHRERNTMIVQIDETQLPFQGKGSKSYAQAQEYREKARSEAGVAVTALKPGRSYASFVGHEYTVMSATAYPAGVTFALGALFRRPLKYKKGAVIRQLLDQLRRIRPWPYAILLDRGYCTYWCLAELVMFCQEAAKTVGATPTHFMMPAIVQRRKEAAYTRKKPRKQPQVEEKLDAMAGVHASIIREWNKGPRQIGSSAVYYASVRRDIKGYPGLHCNLVIFYRIRRSAWKPNPKELNLEKDVAVIPFYTDIEVTPENAGEVNALYSKRWNCENLYQKMVHVLGIIPSKDLYQRVLSFLLGLAAMNTYGVHRVLAFNELGEEGRDELPRLMSFFDVAHRDLQTALDPSIMIDGPPTTPNGFGLPFVHGGR